MPRVACLDSQTKKDREVHALIESRMISLAKTDDALAEYLNIHVTTFRRKKRHPSQFTLLEMQRVARYLNFSLENKAVCL